MRPQSGRASRELARTVVASNERLAAAINAFREAVDEGRLAHEPATRATVIERGEASWSDPHRIGYLGFVAAVPGFAERHRRVPVSAVAEEGDDDEGPFAMVTCPCGGHPIVRGSLAKCDGCERYYVRTKIGAVIVVYGNMDVPAGRTADVH